MFIIIACIVWYVIGVYSCVYWWTKNDDFTIKVIPIALMCGLFGIISFIMGWLIETDFDIDFSFLDTVIVKERNKQ